MIVLSQVALSSATVFVYVIIFLLLFEFVFLNFKMCPADQM